MKLSLNGIWNVKNLTDNSEVFEGNVPSTNFNDLLRNKLIVDPFVKTNEKETLWVGDKDWSYSRIFNISENIISSPRIDLVAECLDTVTEIYINGSVVASTNNAHIGYRFNIKEYLKVGENVIEIIFRSPNKYAIEESNRVSKNTFFTGIDKRVFIRKNQSHFGWDWGPEIPYVGITKDIFLDYGYSPRITDLKVVQKHVNSIVDLDVSFNVIGALSSYCDGTFYFIKITSPNGNVIKKSGLLSSNISRTITIEDPILWWTHELNPVDEQPLYKVEVLIGENGLIDKKEAQIGLRTIELDRSKDEFGSNFRFILNGVPIFAKGANWIPADSFGDRISKDKYAYYVNSAINSNMNMIRVWGGGFYEDEAFYSLCDRKGLLIWQDFAFACRPYPFFDDTFKQNVLNEIGYNVKRISLHPCLALWCGNNELEQMFNTWFWQSAFVKANKKFFWEELEIEVRKYDSSTPYIPTSPVGVEFNKGVSNDNHGDNHLWVVWHGLQDVKYYRKRKTRFCSEFGFESLPDIKTIERFASKEDYSIDSKVFLAHQKCMLGNQKMEYYITSRFRLPKNFEDYVYLSQACQMECIKDATEFWRRNRDRCNGSLYWQLNDCWPVCSWSSIDYYGNYKALQYHAKHFFNPICVSIEGDKKSVKVFVLNDTRKDIHLKLRLRVVDFNNGILDENEVNVEANALSTTMIFDIPIYELRHKYTLSNVALVCDLMDDSEVINTKTLLFKHEKYLNLPKVNINLTAQKVGDNIKIKVRSDKFARLVQLQDKVSMNPFSDNWFDLLPGEEKVIYLPYYDDFEMQNLTVKSSTDIEPKGSRLYDFYKKAKFLLNPVNLAIYLGQPQGNFDFKDKNETR